MPPRTVKRGGAAAGSRKTPRATKTPPKSRNQSEVAEETAKAEEFPVSIVEVDEETKVEEVKVVNAEVKQEVKPSEPEVQPKPEANGSVSVEEKVDIKESFEEDDKGERLELDDNEPEYEAEEDGGVYYYEKEVDHEDAQEGEDEDVKEAEGDAGEEEEGDMVEEEMEDETEEIEGQEDNENVEEEHEEIFYEEEDEHHEVVKERRKRKEFEIFVGGLDKDATEDDLRKVFNEVGEVTEVRLMMNSLTKKNKGFAFLRFATVEQAKRAVTELKNPVVHGKQCGVTPSQDSDSLFLGNICKTWTKEALKEKLKHYGVENIDDLILVEDSNNEGMNRGFAFLEFSSRLDAMDAYKRLQKRDVVFGVDRPARVSFAESFSEPDDEIMAQVKTIFVDGIPASWDEDRVKEHLKKFGVIEKIELARNMPSARRRDFGFVTFDTHDAAVACAEGINNADLGKGDNKVKVRARLSRPRHGGKGMHAIHGDYQLGRGISRAARGPWVHPAPRSFAGRGARGIGGHVALAATRGFKRPLLFRDRRPVMAMPDKVRPLPPQARSFVRRAPVSSYSRGSSKRDYGRHEELPPRSRGAADYGSRVAAERRFSYRNESDYRRSGYPEDGPRGSSRTTAGRPYVDESYARRFERPPPSNYREGRARDYDSISGSKRPYSALDDVPPRYAEPSVRQSKARLDYGVGSSASQYGDAYSERLGRSHIGYGSSRSSLSGQESDGLYGSRQSLGYGGGSYDGNDVGEMYSSSFGSDYMSRGPDIGGSSYSSLYSSRGLGGSGYLGGGGSGSYY
ncbi:heterogeneous nuclear ribonucleoprotein Q-like [Macadamia integrifolia]|uniref:heterogeneous nuclear ribonucleoprotein Q-like n=1 Tax=Macadamia integrifolia TaxID=60698 RepID=UPI001C4E4C68|nr:heterogeneous nuclear ribonucleoprotein Q-like [Macadamia integrifolia]